ncbi:Jag N-terminal domain-containing protein [Sulfurovum sp. zt1-1]|uniref:Jag N-terminal domain-containing protein n=1 Tax=Sulfurovum zhangzhouensis TaxID=3019067 RepID=A0ABT7QWM5_9BACT|nr:Jag N-terminal domain-containing protein [Sulfurovum zhangzhouensis]MDM5270939.1 Jag N-terminal domain-containing protein [Sulfurovum zhangzhouensis]
MKKIKAPTLEVAYEQAAKELGCSVTDLKYEVIQHPSSGIFGFFKKEAIIVASCKYPQSVSQTPSPVTTERHISAKVSKETSVPALERKEKEQPTVEEDEIVENFFSSEYYTEDEVYVVEEEVIVYDELARLIESQLKELMELSCFDIDVVEVDVRDNTALIFIDGEDAALLIGKEGYRYNALSYMLFNWLHTKYELFIKLEIAAFVTTQEEMIRNVLKPVIESVQQHGKGKTRFLDGILVQIALEQLREAFPDKYVAVKTSRDGKKFVVINDFNKK